MPAYTSNHLEHKSRSRKHYTIDTSDSQHHDEDHLCLTSDSSDQRLSLPRNWSPWTSPGKAGRFHGHCGTSASSKRADERVGSNRRDTGPNSRWDEWNYHPRIRQSNHWRWIIRRFPGTESSRSHQPRLWERRIRIVTNFTIQWPKVEDNGMMFELFLFTEKCKQ
jgi:hypothetical protein